MKCYTNYGWTQDLNKLWPKYMIIVGLVTGSIGIIQAIEIYLTGDASGVSLTAWVLDLGISVSWGIHGYKLKDAPLLFSSSFGTIGAVGVLCLCLFA